MTEIYATICIKFICFRKVQLSTFYQFQKWTLMRLLKLKHIPDSTFEIYLQCNEERWEKHWNWTLTAQLRGKKPRRMLWLGADPGSSASASSCASRRWPSLRPDPMPMYLSTEKGNAAFSVSIPNTNEPGFSSVSLIPSSYCFFPFPVGK